MVKKTTMKKNLITLGLTLILISQIEGQSYFLLDEKTHFTKLEYNFNESPLSTPYIVYKLKINENETYFLECGPEIEKILDFTPSQYINDFQIKDYLKETKEVFLVTKTNDRGIKAIKINFLSILEIKPGNYNYSSWKYNLNKIPRESNIAYIGNFTDPCIALDQFSKSFPPDESYYTKIYFNSDLGVIKEEHFTKSGKNVFELKSVNGESFQIYIEKNCEPVLTEKGGPNQKVHDVKKGETLYTISQLYGVSVNELKLLNNLTSDGIQVGDFLIITELKDNNIPSWVGAPDFHTVQIGETVSFLALKYGFTEKRFRYMNGMSDKETLKIGQKILINDCGNISSKSTSLIETNPELFEKQQYEIKGRNKTENGENPLLKRGLPASYDSSQTSQKIHKVAQGETIFSIARKYNVSIEKLRQMNNLQNGDILKAGQIIQIE